MIGRNPNSGCTHFFRALHSAALWAFLRIWLAYFTISSHVIGSKKDHAISFRKWKIKPLYRHDLLTSIFPRFSPAVLASLIGSFERQLTPWLADAITSVFTHGNPIENALRRFRINETAVELRYTLYQGTGKIACMFQGYVISKKFCSIHLSTCMTDANLIRFLHKSRGWFK